MTPQEKLEFETLRMLVEQLVRGEHIPFITNIKRRIDITGEVQNAISTTSLADLTDVSGTTPSNGQVLKYNGSEWAPGTDNIA